MLQDTSSSGLFKATTLKTRAFYLIHRNRELEGSLGGSEVWRLPSAQGMILVSRDRVPHQASCMEPASPLSVSASVCVCVCVSH